jgi:hypothetical protein
LELEKAAEHGARHGVKIKKTWDSPDGYPNYDAPVSALPGTVAAGEEPRYPPTTSGDHLRAQFVRTQVTETAA